MLLIFRRPLRGGFPFLWMSSGCGRFVCRSRISLPEWLRPGFPFADLKKCIARPQARALLHLIELARVMPVDGVGVLSGLSGFFRTKLVLA